MCSTSSSPNCGSVRRVIDINYANKKRATSFKWMFVNIALFSMFVYDLWRVCACPCPGGASAWHYAEAAVAAGALANLALHARRLLRRAPPAPHSPHSPPARRRPPPSGEGDDAWPAAGALRWRDPPSPPRSPPSPPSPQAPPAPPSPASDAFIADAAELAAYVRAHAPRPAPEAEGRGWPPPPPPPPPPPYQLASTEAERGASEEGAAARAPQVWRRLHLDPQRLTQWNLNLRLWLHLTILRRLVREMDEVDAALGALGVEGRLGALGTERLRALAGGAAAGAAAASLRALLPFLEPFADQRYAVGRVRELARDGCLGAYRWDGGGGGWEEGKPTDAELVLHLFAAYVDGQAAGGGRAFSGAHLSAAPAPPPRGPRALSVHRATSRPPHYVLVVGEQTVEACAGRDNLLHTLLLLVAALAALEPPALRLQLGRAGLNLLWVIGR